MNIHNAANRLAAPDYRIWPTQYFNAPDIARHQCAKVKRPIGAGEVVDPHAVDENERLCAAPPADEGTGLATKPAARGNTDARNGLQNLRDGCALQLIKPGATDNFNRLACFGPRLFKAACGDDNVVVCSLCKDGCRQHRKRGCRISKNDNDFISLA